MNTEEKKTFQRHLKTISNVKIPTPTAQFQDVIGKGDGQLDRLCNNVILGEKNLLQAQQSLVDYAKSRLEK